MDIAEDVTREEIEVMGMPGLQKRIHSKVAVKRAVCAFLREAYPVALMVDVKIRKGQLFSNNSYVADFDASSLH